MATKAERAAAREKYCNEKLTPILQEMVAQMLRCLPEEPDDYMKTWLDAKIAEEAPAPVVVSAAPPGTPLQITGEIVPDEEAAKIPRETIITLTGDIAPPEQLTPEQESRLSTMSSLIADTPGASRGTVVTVRGTIASKPGEVIVAQVVVPTEEAAAARLSTMSQLIADTPGASRATQVTVLGRVSNAAEAARVSTLSQVIADTPGASRATVQTILSVPPPVEARPSVGTKLEIENAELVPQVEAEELAARGTVLTLKGDVIPTDTTPQEAARLSTLSQMIADTPGAVRGTLVTVRGTLVSKPGEVIVAQVVVPKEEAERLSTLSQVIADTPGAARGTVASKISVNARGTVISQADAARMSTLSKVIADTPGAARGTVQTILTSVLDPLDSHEEERKISQKRASAQANSEQLRIIAEQEHAAHEAKQERESARKSAAEGMDAERASQVAEHGEAVRKVPSVPNSDELKKKLSASGITPE